MAGWSYTTIDGWTLTTAGSQDYAQRLKGQFDAGFIAGRAFTLNSFIVDDAAWKLRASFAASEDQKTRYFVEIDRTNVRLWKQVLGGAPSAVAAAVAHSLTAARPVRLELRLVATLLEVRVNTVSTALISQELGGASPPPRLSDTAFGFSSPFNGCQVFSAQLCQLETVYQGRADGWWGVSGGRFYYSIDGGAAGEVPGGPFFLADRFVSGAEVLAKVYLVDGTNWWVFDPSNLTMTKVTATGSPPGYTNPGTTRFTQVAGYLGRLVGIDGTDAWLSAVDAPANFQTGESVNGAAYAFSESLPGLIGEPIKGVFITAATEMILTCARSVWRFRGDPVLGAAENNRIAHNIGGTGPLAIQMADQGRLVLHTTQGAATIVAGENLRLLSDAVLSTLIRLEESEVPNYTVLVLRDPKRSGVHFFFTPTAASGGGATTAIWYDERTGNYKPADGGWFQDVLGGGSDMAPTAGCVYLGKALIGTRTGYVLVADDDADDDDGEEIATVADIQLVMDRAGTDETILQWLEFDWTDATTGATMTLYIGETAERAFQGVGDTRRAVWTDSITSASPSVHRIEQRMRAGVLRLTNNGEGLRFGLDAAYADGVNVPRMRGTPTDPTVAERCGPPPSETDDDEDFGEGGGPSGEEEDELAPDPEPIPPICTECTEWMADHHTDVDGSNNPAVRVGDFEFSERMAPPVERDLLAIANEGICDFPENIADIIIECIGTDDAPALNQQMTFADWKVWWAANPGHKYVMVFSCEMQVPPLP